MIFIKNVFCNGYSLEFKFHTQLDFFPAFILVNKITYCSVHRSFVKESVNYISFDLGVEIDLENFIVNYLKSNTEKVKENEENEEIKEEWYDGLTF